MRAASFDLLCSDPVRFAHERLERGVDIVGGLQPKMVPIPQPAVILHAGKQGVSSTAP